MCWVYIDIIDIIATNIPHMKITAVSQWTARFNIQRKPKKCCCLLRNFSFGLFDHKKNSRTFLWVLQNFSKSPGLSRTLLKFQDFPVLSWTSRSHAIVIPEQKLYFVLTFFSQVITTNIFKKILPSTTVVIRALPK